jgi:hypothetical protein
MKAISSSEMLRTLMNGAVDSFETMASLKVEVTGFSETFKILKMETAGPSETLVPISRTSRRHIPGNLPFHGCKNLNLNTYFSLGTRLRYAVSFTFLLAKLEGFPQFLQTNSLFTLVM